MQWERSGKSEPQKEKYLIYALGAACALMVVLLAITKSLVFLWPALAFAVSIAVEAPLPEWFIAILKHYGLQ